MLLQTDHSESLVVDDVYNVSPAQPVVNPVKKQSASTSSGCESCVASPPNQYSVVFCTALLY